MVYFTKDKLRFILPGWPAIQQVLDPSSLREATQTIVPLLFVFHFTRF
jgi:hypothetical protein